MPVKPPLRDLLARAVTDGGIRFTESDALALARTYGAKGVRVKVKALPLSPRDAVATQVLPVDLAKGYRQLAQTMDLPPSKVEKALGQLTGAQRETLSGRAQDRFEADMARITGKLMTSGDLRAWQRESGARILQHLVEQRTLGVGRPLRDSDLRALSIEAQRQTAYLSRFADQLAIRGLQGRVMSAQAITNRAVMYGGAGRAAFYDGEQTREAARGGVVVYYRAVDDGRTCPRCHAAEAGSPYLAGAAPLPGQQCLGHGRCRCRLDYRYEPETWQRLVGRAA